MNTYHYDEIYVGLSAAFTCQVTLEKFTQFCCISGDNNPLHVDPSFAERQGFPDRVVYGMLVASFYSTLVGVHLPGQFCLLQGISIDFLKPVYIDSLLIVKGCVVEKNDLFHRIIIKAVIEDQSGQKVSRAKIEVGVLDEKK